LHVQREINIVSRRLRCCGAALDFTVDLEQPIMIRPSLGMRVCKRSAIAVRRRLGGALEGFGR
jgi:hypothetical protein